MTWLRPLPTARRRADSVVAQATDVYRLGKRDVHHAFRSGGIEFEHDSCRFDGKGNAWLLVQPPGPQCSVCFAGMAGDAPSRGTKGGPPVGRRSVVVASAAAVLIAAGVFASSLDTPVNYFGPYPSGSGTPLPLASIAPGPSRVPPGPSLVLALTPSPSVVPSLAPPTVPPFTFPPLPTYPPVPTFGPLPTWPPFPVIPPLPTIAPPHSTLAPCLHPGTHLGVDPCKWPHN